MSSPRDLLVLIPGLGQEAQRNERKRLIEGLRQVSQEALVTREEDASASGQVVTLKVTWNGAARSVDVREAYWNDLVPSLSEQPLHSRVVRGLSLLFYWTFSRIWQGFLGRKFLTIGFAVSGLALVVWYYGVFALFLEAVVDDPDNWAGWGSAAMVLVEWVDWFGSWEIWVIASVVMGVVPVTLLVDFMDFAKRYLTEEATEVGGVALRFEILYRVRGQIVDGLKAEDYDRVTVVAHSFGTVVAVDVLAELDLGEGQTFRLVTLGSPLELFCRRVAWLKPDMEQLAGREDLEEWVDFTSPVDLFASGSGLTPSERFRVLSTRPHGTMLDRVAARTHARYFDNEDAVYAMLGVEAA